MSVRSSLIGLMKSDRVLLLSAVLLFTLVYSYLSELRLVNFFTANWDLGIMEQMLWTQTHGYLLFETGDFIFNGTNSFLQVHSTYIGILFAYVYYVSPTPMTLFVIQSLAISSSMIPLYLIARRTGMSRGLAYACGLVFILNFSMISATMFDFHWESFIPVEFLSMFYLLERKKHLLSLIPLLVGCATLEVFPFLGFSAALYIAAKRYSLRFFSFRKNLHEKDWQYIVTLMVVSVIAYVAIRAMQIDVIPKLIGAAPAHRTLGNNLASLFYFHVEAAALSRTFLYWALIYLSLGFIPLLYPRHLILALPWLLATIFINPYYSNSFGNQYSVVAITPIIVGFIYAVRGIESKARTENMYLLPYALFAVLAFFSLFAISPTNSRMLLGQHFSKAGGFLPIVILASMALVIASQLVEKYNGIATITTKLGANRLSLVKRTTRYLIVASVALILVFSLILSPLNQSNFKATPQPGYDVLLKSNPEYAYALKISSYVTYGASVLATNNLFPLVANNPNSYSLPWSNFGTFNLSYFPYNQTHLPDFVLVNSRALDTVPAFLMNLLFNASYYGLKAFSFYNEYPGSIYLFRLHYNGTTTSYSAVNIPKVYYFTANNLTVGQSGEIVRDSSSMFGYVIESSPAGNLSGNGPAIWYGPYFTFMPGTYQITMSLKGGTYNKSESNNTPLLDVNSNSFGSGYYYRKTLTLMDLAPNNWTAVNFNISMKEPYPNTEFRGYLDHVNNTANGFASLNYVEVRYTGSILSLQNSSAQGYGKALTSLSERSQNRVAVGVGLLALSVLNGLFVTTSHYNPMQKGSLQAITNDCGFIAKRGIELAFEPKASFRVGMNFYQINLYVRTTIGYL